MQNKKAQKAKKAKQKCTAKKGLKKKGKAKKCKTKKHEKAKNTKLKNTQKHKTPLLALNLNYCLISFKSFKFSTYTLKLGKAKPSPFFSKIRIKSSISFWRASLNSPALMTLV